MRVLKYSIYPKYYETRNFLDGSDIALAIAEIDDPRYTNSSFERYIEIKIPKNLPFTDH